MEYIQLQMNGSSPEGWRHSCGLGAACAPRVLSLARKTASNMGLLKEDGRSGASWWAICSRLG